MQAVFDITANNPEMRVGDIRNRVNAKRKGKKVLPVGTITIEKIPVVKIPVGPAERDDIGGLMDRKVVGFR
jgi:hypothetical protein